VAFITQDFHKERDSINAYIRFENESQAEQAVQENNSIVEGKHIRVDKAVKQVSNN
jgi:RNA recognition motif-containing protein